jgi:hypothetical protein
VRSAAASAAALPAPVTDIRAGSIDYEINPFAESKSERPQAAVA